MQLLEMNLRNWRNFPAAKIPLAKRTFLVGPNASGKSNLLDVFRFLFDITHEGGGLQYAVKKRGGLSKLRSLHARQDNRVSIEAILGTEGVFPEWRYFLELTQNSQQEPRITAEEIFHFPSNSSQLKRPQPGENEDPELLSQTYLEQVSRNKEFRDISEFFSTIRYLHIVPQLIREPERSRGLQDDPFGGDFLERVMRVPERTRSARFRKIEGALNSAIPYFEHLSVARDQLDGQAHLEGTYKHWRKGAGVQREDQFSDGTLRLIGFLWALLDGSGPLLLEEPELSLHSGIARHIPFLIHRLASRRGRQVIASTHSVELLKSRGISPREVLMLIPGREGTVVSNARDAEKVRELMDARLPMSDAVLSLTTPKETSQLSLFG
jgi:predicted ATPase